MPFFFFSFILLSLIVFISSLFSLHHLYLFFKFILVCYLLLFLPSCFLSCLLLFFFSLFPLMNAHFLFFLYISISFRLPSHLDFIILLLFPLERDAV
jgi:hypothetical protein